MKIYYHTAATAQGGRSGTSSLADGRFTTNTALPGSGREGLTPEDLFALGYASCFDNAMKEAAKFKGIALGEGWQTTVGVGLGHSEDNKRLRFDVDITAFLPDLDQATADKLVATTHKLCPFSNSMGDSINVRLTAKVSAD